MSRIETPVQTLTRFDKNSKWRESSDKVLTSDFLSANGESNLLWTPFHYEERDGRLFDPVRQEYVAGSANGVKVEEGIITQLQEWFSTHESGIGVWISPRNPYAEEQITIYRIGYELVKDEGGRFSTKKVLLFSWHQFKKEFKNPEEIRQYIFTEDDSEESVLAIIKWLKGISEKPVSDDYGNLAERQQKASYYAGLYKSGTDMLPLAYRMDQTQFLGKNPIGCVLASTTTPSYGYTSNTTEIYDYLVDDGMGPREFPCPVCHCINRRPYKGFVHRCQNRDCPKPEAVRC